MVITLLLVVVVAATSTSYAAPQPPTGRIAIPFSDVDEHEGVFVSEQSGVYLLAETLPPPRLYQSFERYGFYISAVWHAGQSVSRARLTFDATVPDGSMVQVDVRASADGHTWTPWKTDLSNGTEIAFPHLVNQFQYRALLFGSATEGPELHAVSIEPVDSGSSYRILAAEEDVVAPTYTIRATRLGMVGGRTANGHIIRPNDRFVALPSWSSLNRSGGTEYQVRITYRGRSVVAPVWDVGPWNTHDNYWDPRPERHFDLPRGWPEDHAAYYDGYNNGYAAKGYVRFPTAMDVGDGLWRELGIHGDQGEVEVTYLWLGQDPQATPPPPTDPQASEIVVSETKYHGVSFQPAAGAHWYHTRGDCGEGLHALRTTTTTNPGIQENNARWIPDVPAEGLYNVYVHVPICPTDKPVTQHAIYQVHHRDGVEEVVVNQAEQTSWVLLGQFPFAAGNEGMVYLSDLAGDSGHTLWFDEVKWERVEQEEKTGQQPVGEDDVDEDDVGEPAGDEQEGAAPDSDQQQSERPSVPVYQQVEAPDSTDDEDGE
jgi:hypothetical protein